ncbi:hypothetical protein FEE95_16000 [Maribacter algarum]|uniref:Peptidase E n=1 Tax=Maribacter algarum (ex Zhang et al. 2020) TaxID=2578118 RepID=A0A5S3PTW2_9FLAO|nr:DUF6702 family protein [Maribacter algarum]TMM56130.1 hypothetical protein FEE95_16000 [Maribacter algarum]
MKQLKKGLLILLLPLLAFTTVHKFYVSVTNIGYSEKDDALQITTRIFIDDLEAVLLERYDITAKLATNEESKLADEYLEKYLRQKFQIEIDGENKTYELIGRKYDNDVCIFYLELTKIQLSSVKSIQIQNEILTDLFDEQQNVVHFKINGNKKSFVLLKSDTKGMLKL